MARDRGDTVTADLFQVPRPLDPVPGSLDYAAELCGALSQAVKSSPFSRGEIAARMSDLTGARITDDMINAWTSRSHDRHRFPFEFAAAFEVACETTCLQELLARKRGSRVLVGREALDAELGRIRRQKADLAQKEKHLMNLMKVTQ